MRKGIATLFLFLFLFSCSSQQEIITIKTTTGNIEVIVEIADDLDEQAQGLMYRTSLETNHGMLFVFTGLFPRIFWMKNTNIPLDILFIDETGVIVDIKEHFQPCVVDPCERYTSLPALSVLEVNAGFVAEHSIVVGDSITVA